MPASADELSVTRARSVLAIVDDARELTRAPTLAHASLVRALGRLVAASAIVDCTITRSPLRASVPAWSLPRAQGIDPVVHAMLAFTAEDVQTRLRSDVLDDATWHGSAFYALVRKPKKLDDGVYSLRGGGREVHGLGFHRVAGAPPFTDDDRATVQLVHEELAILDGAPRPSLGAKLPPRLRATLEGLLVGLSEKQIAAHLGISANTTHEYVATLYRRCAVKSRVELLVRAR